MAESTEFQLSFNPEASDFFVPLRVNPINPEERFPGSYGDVNFIYGNKLFTFKAPEESWNGFQEIYSKGTYFPRYSAAVYVKPATMIITGGLDSNNTAVSYAFSLLVRKQFGKDQQELDLLPNMPNKRYLHCLVNVEGQGIYAIGGQSSPSQFLNSVELLSPDRQQWNRIGSMNVARSTFTAIEHEGNLYVFGGFSGYELNNPNLERYHRDTNVWELIQPNLPMLSGMTAVPNNSQSSEYLFIGGSDGWQSTNRVIRFRFEGMETEEFEAQLNLPRARAFSAFLYNQFWVFGGGYPNAEKFDGGIWKMCSGFPEINDYEILSGVSFNKPI